MAFSSYTDDQIGRIIGYLKETGQYENTGIIYAADNGTSGEGSVNANKPFIGCPFPDFRQEPFRQGRMGTLPL